MQKGFATYSSASLEDLMMKIEANLSNLPKQEAKIAQYFLLNHDSLSFETGSSIAKKAGVSEITVGRLLRRFGCSGMKELKRLLRHRYFVNGEAMPTNSAELSPHWRGQLTSEISSLHAVYDQIGTDHFNTAIDCLWEADTVYVTGFQSVRGLAEDTARRLSLARKHVRYLSPHDSMLAEWIDGDDAKKTCLLLIDVVPYAAECAALARLAKKQGRKVVLVTDEYCHWSRDLADATIHSPSATGLFLESVLGLVAALALINNEVAKRNHDSSTQRLKEWKGLAHSLKIF